MIITATIPYKTILDASRFFNWSNSILPDFLWCFSNRFKQVIYLWEQNWHTAWLKTEAFETILQACTAIGYYIHKLNTIWLRKSMIELCASMQNRKRKNHDFQLFLPPLHNLLRPTCCNRNSPYLLNASYDGLIKSPKLNLCYTLLDVLMSCALSQFRVEQWFLKGKK